MCSFYGVGNQGMPLFMHSWLCSFIHIVVFDCDGKKSMEMALCGVTDVALVQSDLVNPTALVFGFFAGLTRLLD